MAINYFDMADDVKYSFADLMPCVDITNTEANNYLTTCYILSTEMCVLKMASS